LQTWGWRVQLTFTYAFGKGVPVTYQR